MYSFHSFDQWSRNLLWLLHISTSTHSLSFVLHLFVEDIFSHLFPRLWSRSVSMAFNLILVWRFHESRALMCFDKGARDQDEIEYSIFNFLSFFFCWGGGGGGWLVFPCTIDPILSTMSCLVQLSLSWQLTRFYYFFFCSLLGPATTSISQHQQNWPGRIISFILGRWVIPILVIYNVFVSVCVCVCLTLHP